MNVTTRRTLEQVKHCVEEALSVVERKEDPTHACNDLDQATQLIDVVLETLRAEARGSARARSSLSESEDGK